MRYTKPVPVALTARITKKQRAMLEEMTREQGQSLSEVLREILERERKRREQAADSMVPPRRP